DFIDMHAARNQREVENVLRKALTQDRARVQVGKISRFGLLEMSRQRLKPSLGESAHGVCPRCTGTGVVRGVQSLSLSILRLLEEEAAKDTTSLVQAILPVPVATLLLNEKRKIIAAIERRQKTELVIIPNPYMETPNYEIRRLKLSESLETDSYKVPVQPELEIVTSHSETNVGKPAEQAAVTSVEVPAAPQHVEQLKPSKKQHTTKKPGIFARILGFFNGEKEESSNKGQRNSRQHNNRNRNNRNRNDRNRNNRNHNNRDRNNRDHNSNNQNRNQNKQAGTQAKKEDNRTQTSNDSRNKNNRNRPNDRNKTNDRGGKDANQNRGNRSSQGQRNSQNRNERSQPVRQDTSPRPERKSREDRRNKVVSSMSGKDPQVIDENKVNTAVDNSKNTPTTRSLQQDKGLKSSETISPQNIAKAKTAPAKDATSQTNEVAKAKKTSSGVSKSDEANKAESKPQQQSQKVSANTDAKDTSVTNATANEPAKAKVVEEKVVKAVATPAPVEIKIEPSVPRKSYSAMAKANNTEVLVSIDFGFKARVYAEGDMVTSNLAEPADIKKSYSPMAKPDLEKLMAG
ncbi:MAG: ribonuclease E/G, partial [Kangiellaceae bacterium]|nr:ribonuclease E/G [Kangiellaceae bacterium]